MAELEADYDKRDRADCGWSPRVVRRGGGRGLYSIKTDVFMSCIVDAGATCWHHTGAQDFNNTLTPEDYAFYGIPLMAAHWEQPCP